VATCRAIGKTTLAGLRTPLIAREAGLSTAAIHYHFATKKKLLQALSSWLMDGFRELRILPSERRVELLPNSAPKDQLDALIRYQTLLARPENSTMIRVFYDLWVQAANGSDVHAAEMRAHYSTYREQVRSALGLDDHWADHAAQRTLVGVVLSLLEGGVQQLLIQPDAFDCDEYFGVVRRIAEQEGATSCGRWTL